MGLISNAYAAAQPAGGSASAGGMQMIIMLAVFGVIFYFMLYRPQAKRNKQHRNLISAMGKNDEVLMSSGIVGKIVKISDDDPYMVIQLDENTKVTIKKDYVTAVLPKGTIQSL